MSNSSRDSNSYKSVNSENFSVQEINIGHNYNINIVAIVLFLVFIYFKLYGNFNFNSLSVNNVKKTVFAKLDSVIHPLAMKP